MIRLLPLTFVVSLFVWPTGAWCQGLDANTGQRPLIFDTSRVDALAKEMGEAARYQTQNHPARDSLWNGVIAGAAVGAMAGAFGAIALFDDCSECAGFNVPLTFGVLGAGIGIGLGAGIDALRSKRASPPGSGAGTVRVSPVVGKGTRGLMASIGF
jgi:hypothetical protein